MEDWHKKIQKYLRRDDPWMWTSYEYRVRITEEPKAPDGRTAKSIATIDALKRAVGVK